MYFLQTDDSAEEGPEPSWRDQESMVKKLQHSFPHLNKEVSDRNLDDLMLSAHTVNYCHHGSAQKVNLCESGLEPLMIQCHSITLELSELWKCELCISVVLKEGWPLK